MLLSTFYTTWEPSCCTTVLKPFLCLFCEASYCSKRAGRHGSTIYNKKKQVQVMSNPLHWKQRLVPLYLRSVLVYSMKKLCKHNILFFLNILLWLFRKINWIKRISQAMQGQYRSSLLEGLVKFKEWKIFKESFSSRQREFPLSPGLQLKKWPS